MSSFAHKYFKIALYGIAAIAAFLFAFTVTGESNQAQSDSKRPIFGVLGKTVHADAPYSQASYYSQANYYSQSNYYNDENRFQMWSGDGDEDDDGGGF